MIWKLKLIDVIIGWNIFKTLYLYLFVMKVMSQNMCAIFDILKSQIFDFYIIYGLIIFLIFSLNFFELFLIDFQGQFRVNFDIVKPFLIKYSYKSIVFPFSISFMFHKLAFIICPILAIKSSFTVLW